MMRGFTGLGADPARRAAEVRIPPIEFLIIENLLPLYERGFQEVKSHPCFLPLPRHPNSV
jgi:hypothetical protein